MIKALIIIGCTDHSSRHFRDEKAELKISDDDNIIGRYVKNCFYKKVPIIAQDINSFLQENDQCKVRECHMGNTVVIWGRYKYYNIKNK